MAVETVCSLFTESAVAAEKAATMTVDADQIKTAASTPEAAQSDSSTKACSVEKKTVTKTKSHRPVVLKSKDEAEADSAHKACSQTVKNKENSPPAASKTNKKNVMNVSDEKPKQRSLPEQERVEEESWKTIMRRSVSPQLNCDSNKQSRGAKLLAAADEEAVENTDIVEALEALLNDKESLLFMPDASSHAEVENARDHMESAKACLATPIAKKALRNVGNNSKVSKLNLKPNPRMSGTPANLIGERVEEAVEKARLMTVQFTKGSAINTAEHWHTTGVQHAKELKEVNKEFETCAKVTRDLAENKTAYSNQLEARNVELKAAEKRLDELNCSVETETERLQSLVDEASRKKDDGKSLLTLAKATFKACSADADTVFSAEESAEIIDDEDAHDLTKKLRSKLTQFDFEKGDVTMLVTSLKKDYDARRASHWATFAELADMITAFSVDRVAKLQKVETELFKHKEQSAADVAKAKTVIQRLNASIANAEQKLDETSRRLVAAEEEKAAAAKSAAEMTEALNKHQGSTRKLVRAFVLRVLRAAEEGEDSTEKAINVAGLRQALKLVDDGVAIQ